MLTLPVWTSRGDPQAIVAGIGGDDHVELQFPGLTAQNGFFGRDQAAYALDSLFNKVKPSGFKVSARKAVSGGQYRITGQWTIQLNGKKESRTLNITLRKKGPGWLLVSVIASKPPR